MTAGDRSSRTHGHPGRPGQIRSLAAGECRYRIGRSWEFLRLQGCADGLARERAGDERAVAHDEFSGDKDMGNTRRR